MQGSLAMQRLNSTSTVSRVRSAPASVSLPNRRIVVRRAAGDADAELEAKLEKLRQARGRTPRGQGTKAEERSKKEAGSAAAAPAKVTYDFTGEQVHWEGTPAIGDLALNVLLGTTLVWLPLTFAAVGRVVFVKYRFTDRRLSVSATAPWKKEQTDVAYQEVKDVVTVGRALGAWGDLVITLRNGDKVELRSLDKYKELRDYILSRRDALGPPPSSGAPAAASVPKRPKGAALTAEELMGEPAGADKGRGF